MNILITGGSGFVGGHLATYLRTHCHILTPTHGELDLTNPEAVTAFIHDNKVDIVIHCAVSSATSCDRDQGFLRDLQMTANLTANVDQLSKLIVIGSGAEFDKHRNLNKVKECDWGSRVPVDPYGVVKYLTNEIVMREPKMLNLRLFGVYGPGDDYLHKFVSNAIVKNLFRLPITIKQDALFDYLFVDDLLPVVMHFLTHDHVHPDYNVTPTRSIKLTEIAQLINQVSDYASPITVQSPTMNYAYTGSNKRLIQELPDTRFTPYRTGIIRLREYYMTIVPTLDKELIIGDSFLKEAKTKAHTL